MTLHIWNPSNTSPGNRPGRPPRGRTCLSRPNTRRGQRAAAVRRREPWRCARTRLFVFAVRSARWCVGHVVWGYDIQGVKEHRGQSGVSWKTTTNARVGGCGFREGVPCLGTLRPGRRARGWGLPGGQPCSGVPAETADSDWERRRFRCWPARRSPEENVRG